MLTPCGTWGRLNEGLVKDLLRVLIVLMLVVDDDSVSIKIIHFGRLVDFDF